MKKRDVTYTITSTFIIPLLGIDKSIFYDSLNIFGSIKHHNRLINGFYKTEFENTYNKKGYVHILIDPYQDEKFDAFMQNLTNHPTYVEMYEIYGMYVSVHRIPEKFKEDYKLIINGKYSLISSEAKQLIIGNRYWTYPEKLLPQVLFRDPALVQSWEDRLGASIGDNDAWWIINDKDVLTLDLIKDLSGASILKQGLEIFE